MNQSLKHLGLILLATLTFATPSFAIDQITLTNGQVVQGKVRTEVPNRHVDFELTNGNTKRFERSEIASVERDVPNRDKDREMFGNQSSGFLSLLAGGAYQFNNSTVTQNSSNNVIFDYGIKVGLNTSQLGDFARLGFALSFDRVSRSYSASVFFPVGSYNVAYSDLNLQLLFMRVFNSGFYFGPNIGLAFASSSYDITSAYNASSSDFEAGLGLGYEVFLSDSFAIGPDVRYEHIFSTGGANYLKFALAGTFHF
ncbi:MAG: hypothetical protein H7333_12485 [Bdellovibrionales bacterium]|nr:hypothetical protein [Oligoflexia bacterium]